MDASKNFRFFFLVFLFVFLPASEAQELCNARTSVNVKENNAVGDLVETITLQDGITASLASADVPFALDGNRLIAKEVLDYEMILIIVVIVENVNDNAPIFPKDTYQIQVKELAPVGTLIGQFPATDLDEDTTLFYRLTSESNYFGLASPENPQLVIQNVLDYDKVQNVEMLLYVQDTPLSGSGGQVSFNATATIQVNVVDVDNRPPWFQPCNKHPVAGGIVCQNTGYTGLVNLNEMEAGPLTLKPGPLHAIDGDVGINEAIVYSFLSGNEDGLFDINPNTGNVSMVKAADVLGTISLTVLAAQTPSSSQFATTSLTVSVQVKSLHIPRFQRPEYQCVVASVGAMATDPTNKDEPLQIIALDEDYAGVGGINPHIVYGVIGSEDFAIVNGYLFMTTNLPEGTLSLQVEAVDTSNGENVRAQLSVEVKSGLTTTALPSSTPDSVTSPSTTEGGTTDQAESTTNPEPSTEGKTTETMESTANTGTSTEGTTTEAHTESTTNSGTPTGDGISSGVTATSESSSTAATESQVTPLVTDGPTSPADPHTEKAPIPPGDFGPGDMAALGATLGVLLLVCAVTIGVLVCRLQRGKADWRKIHEASVFRSSVGQGVGGEKQGVQYTNEAFQHDDDDNDDGGVGSGGPFVTAVKEGPADDSALTSSVRALGTLLDADNISQMSSDKEEVVKPILTKERRLEEGYKAVWFKEDIDPDAKEEVVIIPNSRADDSEDEDDDAAPAKRSQPTELDLDSGLGVRIEDPAEDSESDDVLNVDL
ncbi:cadherin-related family member 5-like [Hippocampus zosterae]|uniref:cadherin-related family member 5-like n=1 Tax=Hippocampus zosterae TaxID=109293 RepID=UPI00223CAB92|nr:cadherin-related family member 5-like [Hippocampus zosterae]